MFGQTGFLLAKNNRFTYLKSMNESALVRLARPKGRLATVLTVVLAVVLTASLAGCAAQSGPQSSEWRLQSLEEASLAAKEHARRQEAEIETLKNRIRALEAGRGPASVSAPLPDEMTLATPSASEPAPAPAARPMAAMPQPMTPPAMQPAAPMESMAPVPAASPAPKPSGLSGAALYNQGMQAYNAKKSEEARSRFSEFVAQNPDDPLAPNALYWIGETYYDQRDFAQAILAFKDVPRRFKDHEKTPAALLKIAYCYEKLGDKNNAIFYLRTLIDEFPGKEPVRAAQTKLKELGG